MRAAALASVPHIFEATMNRDHMRALADLVIEGDDADPELIAQREEMRESDLGMPAAEITHAVDVSDVMAQKRQAMAAHRSQITEDSFFMTMPEEAFIAAFGTEWFIERGAARAGEPYEDDILARLTDA